MGCRTQNSLPSGSARMCHRKPSSTIGIRHPRAGLITLQMFQLRLVDQPELVAVIQVPASPTSLARISSLLTGDDRR